MLVSSFSRALNLELCPRCLCLLCDSSDSHLLTKSDDFVLLHLKSIYNRYDNANLSSLIREKRGQGQDTEDEEKLGARYEHYVKVWGGDGANKGDEKGVLCPCCCNHFGSGSVSRLVEEAMLALKDLGFHEAPVHVKIKLPRSLELMRLSTLAVLRGHGDNLDASLRFPVHSIAISRAVAEELTSRCGVTPTATVQSQEGGSGSLKEGTVYVMLETVSAFYPTISAADAGVMTGPSRGITGGAPAWEDCGEAAWDAEGWYMRTVWPAPFFGKPKGTRRKAHFRSLCVRSGGADPDHVGPQLKRPRVEGAGEPLDSVRGEATSSKGRRKSQREEELVASAAPSLWLGLSRNEADGIIARLKQLTTKAVVEDLTQRMQHFSRDAKALTALSARSTRIAWKVTVEAAPRYLFGRYRKLSREVPQAPWLLNERSIGVGSTSTDAQAGSSGSGSGSGSGGGGNDQLERRKGRASVQEVVEEAACAVLQARACKLHAAGREDIDVRCLGNGRPFALEVIGVKRQVTPNCMAEIMGLVNTKQGLNRLGDVQLLCLEAATKSTWSTMQKVAEEKDKHYTCVVYTSLPVGRDQLSYLENYCATEHQCSIVDEECNDKAKNGRVANSSSGMRMAIVQPTPLRVLHRRPLLNRKRFISEVKCCYLTPHHFLLSLRTTAGTYVKEWVHGDLGRTRPSVKSILFSQQRATGMDVALGKPESVTGVLDITQLDVTWLYDSFSGGGDPPNKAQWEQRNWALNAFSAGALPHASSQHPSSPDEDDQDGEREGKGLERLSWGALAKMRKVSLRR